MQRLKNDKKIVSILLATGLMGGLALLGERAFAQSQQPDQSQPTQQNQPPSSTEGPNPNVGPEVYAPKKTPPPAVQPEKKIERINPNDIYTISTQSNLVNVNVLVTDKDGDPIRNLQRNNFRIYDDGVAQRITNFSTAKAPMTVCLLIEFSNKYWQYLYLALEDAYQFLDFMQPKDWVAVVDFDLKPHILQDFTHDGAQVRAALDTLRIPGFSEVNFYDALAFTLDRMKNIQGRKAIVPIVTGCDTFSKINYSQILKIAKTSDTPIYPVSIMEYLAVRYGENISCGPGTLAPGFGGGEYYMARNALDSIAKVSGGQAYFPRFEAAIPDAYRQIEDQLRQEYSLGFIPTNPARDGKFHKLKVDLVSTQGGPLRIVNQKGKAVKYRIVARDGYYAPKS